MFRIPSLAKFSQAHKTPLYKEGRTLSADTKNRTNIVIGLPFSPKQKAVPLLRCQVLNSRVYSFQLFLLPVHLFRVRVRIHLISLQSQLTFGIHRVVPIQVPVNVHGKVMNDPE